MVVLEPIFGDALRNTASELNLATLMTPAKLSDGVFLVTLLG